MKEINTVQIIKNGLLECFKNGWYYKPKDIPGVVCIRQKGVWVPTRFTPKNPIDIIFFWNSNLLAIEAKIMKRNLIPFDIVKEHQAKALIDISLNNGSSYVAIHYWEPRSESIIYFIDIFDFLHWKKNAGRKSITKEMLKTNNHVSFSLNVFKNKINFDKTFILGI